MVSRAMELHVIQTQLSVVVEYLKPWLPLANCHMVSFITASVWDSYVPQDIRTEVGQVGIEGVYQVFARASSTRAPFLSDFFTKARNMCLCTMKGILLSRAEFYDKLSVRGCDIHNTLHIEEFMSSKKRHEVEVMSEIIAALTVPLSISHIVDVGGGKGYLSSMLALHHQLQVLGVDCSLVNSHGAAKRTERLQKVWNGLCRRAYEIGHGQTPVRHGKHWKSKEMAANSECYESDRSECSSRSETTPQSIGGLYKQATAFVTGSTRVEDLIEEHFPDSPCTGLMLVGLHTCGNLAPTCLKLYAKNQCITSVCNVGCCYHLLEEKFFDNPFVLREELSFQQEIEYGFPMSHYLTSQNFALGRNARMLAAQSLDRISEKGRVPVQSLFYRALLQVLLIRKYRKELPSWQVGRVARKCEDFVEYVSKAASKLELDLQITPSEIEDLYTSFSHKEGELEIFFLLRLALAPVIETVILLDRLLYLHEQGMNDTYLVQLFDPIVSPRCYGLVSTKLQYLSGS